MQIFGNENAEFDELLYDCAVPPPTESEAGGSLILTGRWGTGKSAKLLLGNRKLNQALQGIDQKLDRAWYVDEQSLDAGNLSRARETTVGGPEAFRRALERVWTTEILRKAVFLLGSLRPLYGDPQGDHWSFVKKMYKVSGIAVSVWQQLTSVLKFVVHTDAVRLAGANELQDQLSDLLSDVALRSVYDCLQDIKGHSIQPVVAIEPIETPTSALEQHATLAQEVVAALLNVFQSKFQPGGDRQPLQVYLAIPWHRYSDDDVDLPQKIKQYKTYLQWGSSELRFFINRRIEYEFSRVKRSFTQKGDQDAWAVLFSPHVKNGHCRPDIIEDAFDYALRHTHHRPRELQRLARNCVIESAQASGRSTEDVLKGVAGLRIEEAHIRAATSKYTRDASRDVITEARRKYSQMDDTLDCIKGIRVPFTKDELKRRIQRSGTPSLDDTIRLLWQAGVLGVQVTASDDSSQNLNALLPPSGRRFFKNVEGKVFSRWYYFEYNYEGDANEFFVRFEREQHVNVKLILHPTTFETLSGKVSLDCPIGI